MQNWLRKSWYSHTVESTQSLTFGREWWRDFQLICREVHCQLCSSFYFHWPYGEPRKWLLDSSPGFGKGRTALSMNACVCVCVWERERERERESLHTCKEIQNDLPMVTIALQETSRGILVYSRRSGREKREWEDVSGDLKTTLRFEDLLGGLRELRKLLWSQSVLQFSSVHSFIRVRLFATPCTAAHQASLSITNSRVYSSSCPSSHWCHPTISSSVIP